MFNYIKNLFGFGVSTHEAPSTVVPEGWAPIVEDPKYWLELPGTDYHIRLANKKVSSKSYVLKQNFYNIEDQTIIIHTKDVHQEYDSDIAAVYCILRYNINTGTIHYLDMKYQTHEDVYTTQPVPFKYEYVAADSVFAYIIKHVNEACNFKYPDRLLP